MVLVLGFFWGRRVIGAISDNGHHGESETKTASDSCGDLRVHTLDRCFLSQGRARHWEAGQACVIRPICWLANAQHMADADMICRPQLA